MRGAPELHIAHTANREQVEGEVFIFHSHKKKIRKAWRQNGKKSALDTQTRKQMASDQLSFIIKDSYWKNKT